MRTLRTFAAIAVAALLAGCGHTEYYKLIEAQIKAQGELEVKATELKIEQAKAETEKWRQADKIATSDVGRAVLGVALAVSEVSKGSKTEAAPKLPTFQIPPPRDALDYFLGFARGVSEIGNAAANVLNVTEGNKTARHRDTMLVRMEEVRQGGETARATAPRSPTSSVVITAQGPVVTGGVLDASDNRDCRSTGGSGGAGAPGGSVALSGITGGAGPLSLPSLIAGAAASGGAGGNAAGNCR